MKKMIFFAMFVLFPMMANADCWQIRNEDARNMCLAKVKGDPEYCWHIRNEDERKYCLAIVKSDRNYCWQIQNEDKKRECLALL
jgi:hypothetical protein